MAGGFDCTVTGLDDVARVVRDLRAIGEKELPKEMRAAGKRIGEPAKDLIRDAAREVLPQRGGLNSWVADRLKFTILVKLAGKNVGIRIKTKHTGRTGATDLPAINRGKVRHPLFGDTDHWYLTDVPAGFVARALEPMADTAEAEFLAAVDAILARYAAGG